MISSYWRDTARLAISYGAGALVALPLLAIGAIRGADSAGGIPTTEYFVWLALATLVGYAVKARTYLRIVTAAAATTEIPTNEVRGMRSPVEWLPPTSTAIAAACLVAAVRIATPRAPIVPLGSAARGEISRLETNCKLVAVRRSEDSAGYE
jgi:hypothetical protein